MRWVLGVVVALSVLTACGTSGDEQPGGSGASASLEQSATPPGTATASPAPSVTPVPSATSGATISTGEPSPTTVPGSAGQAGGYVADCAPQGAVRSRLEALHPKRTVVSDGHGSSMPATTVGSGRTLVLLFHQIHGGACGWQYFLARAGSDARFRFVAADLCGSGASRCVGDFALDQVAQAELLLDWARQTYHPAQVVAMGSSMGGAIVVRAAGLGLPVDAVVDISGPDGWFDGRSIATDIRRSSVPMLLVYDPSDDPASAKVARDEAQHSGGLVGYLEVHAGHGWANLTTGPDDRLTRASQTMLDFAARG